MSVKINVHKTHRQYTDGLEVVEVNGKTVGECLEDLVTRYHAMKNALFDGKGKLQNVVEIYINMDSAYPNELAKPVRDGDVIYITVMLAGG